MLVLTLFGHANQGPLSRTFNVGLGRCRVSEPALATVSCAADTSRSVAGIFGVASACLWPGPEILVVKLLAENRPFAFAIREEFKCNSQRQLMAYCVEKVSLESA